MKLYHGSKKLLKALEPKQAQKGDVDVSEDQLQHAIYLSPDYGFALAMGARPENSVTVTHDGEGERTIDFEKPELFKPDETVYIYSFDSEDLDEQNLQFVSEFEYALVGVEVLPVSEIKETKARELLNFYTLTNWNENAEIKNEVRRPFKIS